MPDADLYSLHDQKTQKHDVVDADEEIEEQKQELLTDLTSTIDTLSFQEEPHSTGPNNCRRKKRRMPGQSEG